MRPDPNSDLAGAESEYGDDTGFAAQATNVEPSTPAEAEAIGGDSARDPGGASTDDPGPDLAGYSRGDLAGDSGGDSGDSGGDSGDSGGDSAGLTTDEADPEGGPGDGGD